MYFSNNDFDTAENETTNVWYTSFIVHLYLLACLDPYFAAQALLCIAILGLLTKFTDVLLLVAAAGAMIVILFSGFAAPFAQPRNCVVGNTLGGLAGVSVVKLFEACGVDPAGVPWAAGGVAVATTAFLQERTRLCFF